MFAFLVHCLFIAFYLSGVIHCTENVFRLPTTILPTQYNITLTPNFSDPRKFTFSGDEQIDIEIANEHFQSVENDQLFTLQIHRGPQMHITDIAFSLPNLLLETGNTSYNATTQIMAMTFNITNADILNSFNISDQQQSTSVHAVLHLTFHNILRDDMKGFYISKYEYENTTIYNAITQFESTDARRCFPSFDEPSFKARFRLTIIAPQICTVLSNMNVLGTTFNYNPSSMECPYHSPSQTSLLCKKVEFAVSPPMSTYLVAIVVGLYGNVSNITESGLPISIYFPLESDADHATYALDAAVTILPFYEQLFGAFPLPKMDCIAVSDFSAGAMENFGLVTYRRTALLADAHTSSESALRRVVVVIAHEFAHQWFGDVVTMQWWNDLWLNEGFASFVEHIGTNFSHSEFTIWEQMVLSMDRVLWTDSSRFTHAIESEVNDPNEIDTLFDSVTYDKGMSVIRMLYAFLGNDRFMAGIRAYLSAHAYGNADTQQLWTALGGEEDSADITAMMNSWVLQSGFPVLKVGVSDDKTSSSDLMLLNVTQKRMNKAGPDGDRDDDDEQLWLIPLQVRDIAGGVTYSGHIMKNANEVLTVSRTRNAPDGMELYLLNAEMNGFFRVLYDETLFADIVNVWLSDDSMMLSEFDKFSLLSDQLAFMLSGYTSAVDYIQFLQKIAAKEADNVSYLIWNNIIDALLTVDSLFCAKYNDTRTSADQFHFRRFARDLIRPIWSRIHEWNVSDTDSENAINLRSLLLYALVRFYDAETIEYGHRLLMQQAVVNGSMVVDASGAIPGIDSNIVRATIECGLSYQAAGNNTFLLQELMRIYSALNSEYQSYVLRAIGAVYTNDAMHMSALQFVLQSGEVRDQDKLRGLYSLRRCYGRQQMWTVMTTQGFWEQLFAVYESGFAAQDLTEIADSFASEAYLENVYDFYIVQSGHRTSANQRSVNQTLENIAVSVQFMQDNYEAVNKYVSGLYASNEEGTGQVQKHMWFLWMLIGIVGAIMAVCVCIRCDRFCRGQTVDLSRFAMFHRISNHDENGNETQSMMQEFQQVTRNRNVNLESIDIDDRDL